MAHIGVIEELEKSGYKIAEVAGSSMGALVGGIYCAGHLEDYRDWLLTLDRYAVFKLLDFTLASNGVLKAERVLKAIESLIGDHQIEDLEIPFVAVASDLISQKEVHYRSGSLFKALRASIAVPTLITPVSEGGSLLVDGGVLNPLPLNLISPERGDIVVAVKLNSNAHAENLEVGRRPLTDTHESEPKAIHLRVVDAVRTQMLHIHGAANEKAGHFGFLDLLSVSFDLLQERLTDLLIDLYKPDLVVNIPRDVCGVYEFYRAREVIDAGRRACRGAIEQAAAVERLSRPQ